MPLRAVPGRAARRRPARRQSPVLRSTTLPALGLALTVALAGCSSADPAAPSTRPTDNGAPSSGSRPSAPTSERPVLAVRISGAEVLPNAEEIELGVGEPLRLEVESDRAGELHVHASPEQFIEFASGSTESELTIETPGQVEVEDHETGAVVALLAVR